MPFVSPNAVEKPPALTPQQELFVASYLTHFNAARAGREAGYQGKWIHSLSYRLTREPLVAQAIAEGIEKKLAKLNLEGDQVLRRWLLIATADPNELMETRRNCCRYCYGEGGRYQRTQREFDRDLRDHEEGALRHAKIVEADLTGDIEPWPDFDPKGGVGFNPTLSPSPECMECFGEGVLEVHVKDSRELSPAGRALFAGIKQTKDGIEVKMHSQEKAWENIGRYLNLIKDKVEVEHTGDLVDRLTSARKRVAVTVDDGEDLAG